jgi:Protein of unknown function (DUF3168)
MNTGNYIYAKLTATAGVTALVSTRIYPVLMPDKLDYPAIVYSVSNRPLDANMKDRGPYHDQATVTFNFWADVKYGQDGYTSLDAIDAAVRAALDFVTATAGGVTCETCKYIGSEDIFSEDRLLIGRAANYQMTIKN